MVPFMKEKLNKTNPVDKVNFQPPMEMYTLENSKKAFVKEMEKSLTKMETSTKDNGKTTKKMDKVCTDLKMETFMKESG